MATTKLSNNVVLPVTGATNENEGTPTEQRTVALPTELSEGPNVDPQTGTYLPCAYLIAPGIVRIDR